MKKLLAKAILTSSLVVAAMNVHAWDTVRNFNSGVVGVTTSRQTDGFDGSANDSIYSSERTKEGSFSAKLQIAEGETAYGDWGGVINFPSLIKKGEQVWLEFYIYIPSSFVIKTPSNGSLKFIRFLSKKSSGDHNGYIDLQIMDDGSANQFRMTRESQGDGWYKYDEGGTLKRDMWNRINVSFVADETPAASGGRSSLKFWLNGRLVVEEKRIKTLLNASDTLNAFYLFTYWNGSAPKSQHLWVDSIHLTNQRPAWADGFGDEELPVPPAAPQLKISAL